MPRRDGQAADGGDVTCSRLQRSAKFGLINRHTRQRKLQLARRQVPDLRHKIDRRSLRRRRMTTHLYHAISRAGSEPLVARLDGDRSHPSQVAGDDSHEPPLRVEVGLDGARLLATDEGLAEEGGLLLRLVDDEGVVLLRGDLVDEGVARGVGSFDHEALGAGGPRGSDSRSRGSRSAGSRRTGGGLLSEQGGRQDFGVPVLVANLCDDAHFRPVGRG